VGVVYQIVPLGDEKGLFIEDMEDTEPFAGYYKGEPIKVPKIRARLIYRRQKVRKPDFLMGIQVFPVVSRKFRSVVESVEPESVQFIPVAVVCRETGAVDSNYAFMNILGNLDAFDWQRSTYTEMTGVKAVLEAEKICLRRQSVGTRQIFRVDGILTELFVGSRMRQAMQAAELTGFIMTPVECF
jgi:hypothetical protein